MNVDVYMGADADGDADMDMNVDMDMDKDLYIAGFQAILKSVESWLHPGDRLTSWVYSTTFVQCLYISYYLS